MLGLPGSLGAADGEDDHAHEDSAGDVAPGEDDGCDDDIHDAGDAGACVASGDGGDDDGGDDGGDDVGDFGWSHEDEGGESEPEEHDPAVEVPLEVAVPPKPIALAPVEPKDIGWCCIMIMS